MAFLSPILKTKCRDLRRDVIFSVLTARPRASVDNQRYSSHHLCVWHIRSACYLGLKMADGAKHDEITRVSAKKTRKRFVGTKTSGIKREHDLAGKSVSITVNL